MPCPKTNVHQAKMPHWDHCSNNAHASLLCIDCIFLIIDNSTLYFLTTLSRTSSLSIFNTSHVPLLQTPTHPKSNLHTIQGWGLKKNQFKYNFQLNNIGYLYISRKTLFHEQIVYHEYEVLLSWKHSYHCQQDG